MALAGNGLLSLADTAGGAVALSVGGNGQSTTFSGALSGAGGEVAKVGAGFSTLSGNNTYSGSFTIGSASAPAGVGLTSPAGHWAPNPSGGIVVANGKALRTFQFTRNPNQTGYSILFGPGVTSGTFGSLED